MKLYKQLTNFDQDYNVMMTVDADWAPEFMIKKISNIFLKNNISATFFVTHKSNFLKELVKEKNFEIGIHFYKFAYKDEKAQKKHDEELINFYSEICDFYKTDIISNRFHRLQYSYRDFEFLKNIGIKNDLSCLLFNQKNIEPHYNILYDIIQLPYFFEDGICENIGGGFYSKIEIFSKGMKIFNFHPLNVYINSSKKAHREFLFKIPDLVSVEEDFVKQFINKESFGSCDFLIELIKKLKKQKSNFFKVNNFAKKLYENK